MWLKYVDLHFHHLPNKFIVELEQIYRLKNKTYIPEYYLGTNIEVQSSNEDLVSSNNTDKV